MFAVSILFKQKRALLQIGRSCKSGCRFILPDSPSMLTSALRGSGVSVALRSFLQDITPAAAVALEGCNNNAGHAASQNGQTSVDLARACCSRHASAALHPLKRNHKSYTPLQVLHLTVQCVQQRMAACIS